MSAGAHSSTAGKNESSFFTVKDIARRWQCSEKHVRRLIEKGELPAHRLGNAVRISDDDLRRYERTCRLARG